MAARTRTGFDYGPGRSYYATVESRNGRAVLTAAGILAPGERVPRDIEGSEAHAALRGTEVFVMALPGVAIEEAEEAFRWEVAKSAAAQAESIRHVRRRGPGTDSAPPYIGAAVDHEATEMRVSALRAAGLMPAAVTVDVTGIEKILHATGKLPAQGTVLHLDIHQGTSVVSIFGAAGLALRRTIRTPDITAEGVAIDLQRSASYAERKLSLPAAESVYLSGEGVDAALAESVARGLPGLNVGILDPFAAIELGQGVAADVLRPMGAAFTLAIGLALLERPEPDFLPPVDRKVRAIRRGRRQASRIALFLIPVVLASGAYAQHRGAAVELRLEEARARYARVELLERRAEEMKRLGAELEARRAVLRNLGEREKGVAALILALAAALPEEAYLNDFELKRSSEDFDLKVRGELVAADESSALSCREPLRKITQDMAPGAQVVFDAARRVQGRVRLGFSIDGVLGKAAAAGGGGRQ